MPNKHFKLTLQNFIKQFRHTKSKLTLISLGLIITLSPLIYLSLKNTKETVAWFNEGWYYRKAINITNSSGSNLSDFQVKVLADYDMSADVTAGKVQADFDDLRFTDINGNLLNYWIEDNTSSSLDVWIKIPSLPSSGTTVYLYYGNPSASSGKAHIGTEIFPALSCKAIYTNGNSVGDGVYWLDPSNGVSAKIQGYCDMTTQGGGWTLLFQRRGGGDTNSNRETCGTTVNSFLRATCGNIASLGYNDSYSIDLNTISTYTPASFLLYQFDSNMNIDSDDAFTINTSSFIFPDSIGTMNDIAATSICDLNGANCDTTDTYFKYTGDGWYGSANCANGYSSGTYKGNYGYCQNGIASYVSNGLFGNRSGYDETKLWNYPSYVGDNYMERTFIKENGFTFSSASAASPGTEEQSKAPIAYWKFDEGTGTTANDSTQNQNNATLGTGSSAPTWQAEDMCVSGKCLYFDGTNDLVTAINSASLSPTLAISVSVWVKTGTNQSAKAVISKGPSGQDYDYMLYFTSAGVSFYIKGSEGYDYLPATFQSYADNKWHHYTAIFDGDYLKLYIDGKLATSKDTNLTNIRSTSNSLRIGQGWGNYFTGFIDEVKIYSYARSAAEIKTDYNSRGNSRGTAVRIGSDPASQQGPTLSNGLVGYWKMDEASWNGTPNEVIDSSGNGNHGVGVGATAPPTTTAGKYGNAGEFDGGISYVNIGDTGLFDFGTNDFSVSAWYYRTSVGSWDTTIVSKWNSGGSPGTNEWALSTGSTITGADPSFSFESSSTYYSVSSPETISLNNWYHITGIRKNDYIYIYVNGIEKAKTYVGNASVNNIAGRTVKFAKIDGGPYGLIGKIDEVRIYNRALSPAEVRTLYNWAPGPVGYWKFDEGSGGSVADKSGYGNTGTWSGTGNHWTEGKYGKAGKFNGTDDYVSTNLSYSTLGGQYSICVWAKLNDLSIVQSFLSFGNTVLVNVSATDWRWQVNGSSATEVKSTTVRVAGQWYQYCISSQGVNAGQTKLYTNGVQQDNAGAIVAMNNGTTNIGRQSNPAIRYVSGLIDDVRIYNYALTPGQIVEDMNAGHPIGGSPIASQLAYYKFDEGYGSTVNNSGFGGTTLNGTLAAGTASPTWTNNGIFGKALDFNGTSNYLTVSDTGDYLDFGLNNFSISAWIYSRSYPSSTKFLGKGANTGWRWTRSGNNLCFEVYTGSGWVCFNSSPFLTTNQWMHITTSIDRSNNTITFYLNGKKTNTVDISSISSVSFANSAPFSIGRDNWGTQYHDGFVDEVKIYNTALTEDQVALDYNRGTALTMGSLSSGTGNTAPSTAASQEYCIPGDTATCSPPVARWDFNEKTGTTAYDSSGNGNNGTLGTGNSAPIWTSGKIGGALRFDNNDYVTVSNGTSSNLGGASAATFAGWVKRNAIGTRHSIIDLTISGTNSKFYIDIQADNTVRVGGRANSGDSFQSKTTTTFISDTNWHFIVGILDIINDDIKIYIDGISQTTTGTPSWAQTTFDADVGTLQTIGSGAARTNYHNGLLDQVRIYNYARTPAQIAWDYNRGAPILHLKLDECQGTTAYDSSGIGNTGMINIGASGTQTTAGTCGVGNTAAAWSNGASGKYNSSLNFDGTDDYVDCGNNSIFNIGTGNHTLAGWVYPTAQQSKAYGYLVAIGNNATGKQSGVGIKNNDKLFQSAYTSPIIEFNYSIPAYNTWYYLTFVHNSGTTSLYVNGQLKDSQAITISTNNGKCAIGDHLNKTGAGSFTGKLDDVRIYNYALTSTQIKTLYNSAAIFFGPSESQ